MFIEERHNQILKLLAQNGRVTVSELTEMFDVSIDSIRRDLRILEEKSLIKKTHGGAMLPDNTGVIQPIKERRLENLKGKEQIALKAAGFVDDGNTIFLESSSTVALMVPYLQGINDLTIFTNSLEVCNSVIRNGLSMRLFIIGGQVNLDMENTSDSIAVDFIRGLHVDKVFSGVCSIHSDWGLSTAHTWEVPMLNSVLNAGKEIFFLADSSKFQKKATMRIAPLLPHFHIITDLGSDSPEIDAFERFKEEGLKIHFTTI